MGMGNCHVHLSLFFLNILKTKPLIKKTINSCQIGEPTVGNVGRNPNQETVENGSVGYGVGLMVLVLWLLSFAVFFCFFPILAEDVALHMITFKRFVLPLDMKFLCCARVEVKLEWR